MWNSIQETELRFEMFPKSNLEIELYSDLIKSDLEQTSKSQCLEIYFKGEYWYELYSAINY